MTAIKRLHTFTMAVAVGASVMASSAWADCVKSVRWRHDPPYSMQAADGSITGLNIELTRLALERVGCTPAFVDMPWARALIELEAGRLDILPGALQTKEREAFAYFSRPTNQSPNVLFISTRARQRFTVKRLADIIGTDFRLGAQIKVSYGPEYAELLPTRDFGARLTFLTDRRSAWRMIDANRLDGLIADQITGLLELKELGLSERIVQTEVIVSDNPAHIALSRRSIEPAFFERFNQALEAMVRDGSVRTLAQRYLPCKIPPGSIGCR